MKKNALKYVFDKKMSLWFNIVLLLDNIHSYIKNYASKSIFYQYYLNNIHWIKNNFLVNVTKHESIYLNMFNKEQLYLNIILQKTFTIQQYDLYKFDMFFCITRCPNTS